jgi:hypothetical protein
MSVEMLEQLQHQNTDKPRKPKLFIFKNRNQYRSVRRPFRLIPFSALPFLNEDARIFEHECTQCLRSFTRSKLPSMSEESSVIESTSLTAIMYIPAF